jgi:protein-tyrosine phosphatase
MDPTNSTNDNQLAQSLKLLTNSFTQMKGQDGEGKPWKITAAKIIGFVALNFMSLTISSSFKRERKASNKILRKKLFNAPYSNFRAMGFSIGNQKVVIAGMGHPKNNSDFKDEPSMKNVIKELKTIGFSEMISLDNQLAEVVKQSWSDQSHCLHQIFVEDYSALTLEQSLDLLKIVSKSALTNKNVVIHCGEGWGRTGSALATICLMQLLMEEKKVGRLDQKYLPRDKLIEIDFLTDTTSLVYQAVIRTRELKNSSNSYYNTEGSSVELIEQIEILEQVEKYLRKNLDSFLEECKE